jgi:hypothetical protein
MRQRFFALFVTVLKVFMGISFTAQTLTVQHCLAYFNSVANNVHVKSDLMSSE